MPVTEMTVTIAIVAGLALGFIQILRLIHTVVVHKTVRKAVERDPASAEPLLLRLTAPPAAKAGDHRLSIVLIAVGFAMIGATLIIADAGIMRFGIAAALFPLIVGAALWLRLHMLERARRRAQQ